MAKVFVYDAYTASRCSTGKPYSSPRRRASVDFPLPE